MNSFADNLSLSLGILDSLEAGKEALGCVDGLQPDMKMAAKELLDGLPLARAKQAVVDKDAGKLIPDGFMHKAGGYRRVHPARSAQGSPGRRPPFRGSACKPER